jgi:PIN domain nuclease of toxin-antitoxin system
MPRLLLDTHTFLWWVSDAPEFKSTTKRAIANNKNECYLSVASCWEMAIKASIGKLRLAKPMERFITEQLAANGFALLNVDLRHAAKVETLPFYHRDPFDRLLIAQAMMEKLTIVSADRVFSKYGVKVLW